MFRCFRKPSITLRTTGVSCSRARQGRARRFWQSRPREEQFALGAALRSKVEALPQVRIMDRGAEQCAIVTVAIAGRDLGALKLELRARGINTSISDRDDGVMDMSAKGVTQTLRLSPHYYNTEAELDAAVATLDELTRR